MRCCMVHITLCPSLLSPDPCIHKPMPTFLPNTMMPINKPLRRRPRPTRLPLLPLHHTCHRMPNNRPRTLELLLRQPVHDTHLERGRGSPLLLQFARSDAERGRHGVEASNEHAVGEGLMASVERFTPPEKRENGRNKNSPHQHNPATQPPAPSHSTPGPQ